MNAWQYKILCLGLIIGLLLLVFPPWVQSGYPVGHHLFLNPERENDTIYAGRRNQTIDAGALLEELAAVSIITALLLLSAISPISRNDDERILGKRVAKRLRLPLEEADPNQCPACGGRITPEVSVCPSCGINFGQPRPEPPDAPQLNGED